MADVLQVESREQVGSAASRRLRRNGQIPAVLYGHGEENQHLTVSESQVQAVLRHHSKMVKLEGAVSDTALVSVVHWDPLGIDVLHLDLVRVNLKELVDVTVPIHLHGDAVGTREGGILLENVHEAEIRCPAGEIPESLTLNVTELHVGEHLTAGDLELPEGVELTTPADTVVAHVEIPRAAEPEEGEADEAVEQEVISKGGEKEEQED